MVFGPSVLNRVYNFQGSLSRTRPRQGMVARLHRVFGNPKSETLVCIYFRFILVNNASRQLSFHLRFTAVNAKFWDFSPSLLGSVLFYLL